MTLKTKTYDVERVATVRRTSERTLQTASKHECCPDHDVLQRAIASQSSALRPNDVLALQRTVGNRAVRQILQAKLAVGPANDHYEREADRVAASVMSKSAAPQIQRQGLEEDQETIQTKSLASTITPLIQRQELSEEEENPVQTKSNTIQRQEAPTEEDENDTPVQFKRDGGPASVTSGVENAIDRARGGGQPLPDGLLTRMEKSFGADFSAVRVHADSDSDTLNRSLHARAFTTGHDLFFRGGEYSPDSRRGQELIAHELTHVVQQNGSKGGKKDLSLKRIIQRDWFDEERGFFNADPTGTYGNIPGSGLGTRRENYNRDDKRDLGHYGLLGLGATSAVAKAASDRGPILFTRPENLFTETVPLASDLGQGLSWMGAISAGAGTATSLVDTYKGFREASDSATTTAQHRIGMGAGLSGLASATQQSATSAFHAANIVANPAMAATAQTVAGGAGIATGAVDILRGLYAHSKAKRNVARLQHLRDNLAHEGLLKAARQAQTTQKMRQSTAKWTVAKGVFTAVGGGLLLGAATVTPIGWLLIGAGAILGAIGAYRKYTDKKKRAEEVAIRELGLVQQMDVWKADEERIKKKYYRWIGSQKEKLAELGPSPLERKLKELRFISAGHFYANFIHKTANDIYAMGVQSRAPLEIQARERILTSGTDLFVQEQYLKLVPGMSSDDMRRWLRLEISNRNPYPVVEELLAGMGLKFDFKKNPPEPKPEKIGKALHD